MSATFSSQVQYANGRPAANVRVRLFDRDVSGADDDLTIAEGVSDAQGQFTVTFLPQKKLNFRDIYLPYLRFTYERSGQAQQHHAFIQPFLKAYKLPVIPPAVFAPATHGFQFSNSFPGYWIPYSIPAIPDIPSTSNTYGLCGGMVAAAYDFLLAERPLPERRRRPGRASPLHQYLHQRQVDSFGAFGHEVVRFARWMVLSDEAVEMRTLLELSELRKIVDGGNPVPIGLVYNSARDTLEIWQNHQVLAVGYQQNGDQVTVPLYDPNFPRTDNVHLACRVAGDRLLSEEIISPRRSKHVRGWFIMEYRPVTPPTELTVDI